VENNPLTRVDPNGHFFDIILDIGFIAYDIYSLVREPSWANATYLALDVGAALVPFATGIGAAAKAASYSDDIYDSLRYGDDLYDSYKGYDSVDNIAGACNCFIAGTKVLTDEGEKNIEDIEVGDKVLSKDEETGEQDYKEVVALHRNEKETTYKLSVGNQIIETTDNHPFWVDGKGWVLAVDLKVGYELVQSNGNHLKIDNIEIVHHDEKVKVYNFTVVDFHTYFVSSLGIWVHNINCSAKGLIGKQYEDYLTERMGGNGSFSMGGRDFDGGTGTRWWEAKSGDYWNQISAGKYGGVDKFKSDMGDRLRIATENGATYELHSNSSIPQGIKDWLTKKGIGYMEWLD
jgi:hypothetical protein